jgi:predicted transposase/invertase (TIGR01784 family)
VASNPHDLFFKAVFGRPEHAAAQLRAVLPAGTLARLDLSTLTPCSGSFVGEELRDRHCDLLFEAVLREGGSALVYVLIEHQSTFDPWLPLRLLGYQLKIWERYRRDHPGTMRLPAIVPVVLCHGDGPWVGSTRFADLIELPESARPAFAKHLVDFQIAIDDLSHETDDSLLARSAQALVRLAWLALRHGRHTSDLELRLLRWIRLLEDVLRAPGGAAAFALVQRYILEVSPHVHEEFFEARLAPQLPDDAKETIVTTGQQLIERGRQQGRRTALASVLSRLLSQRFGELPPFALERIESAAPEQLEAWTARVLDAKSIAEVFAG